MNIYLVKRTDCIDWDQYAGMVIIAESEDDAISVSPDGNDKCVFSPSEFHDWAHSANDLEITLLGEANPLFTEKKVILTDYRAG